MALCLKYTVLGTQCKLLLTTLPKGIVSFMLWFKLSNLSTRNNNNIFIIALVFLISAAVISIKKSNEHAFNTTMESGYTWAWLRKLNIKLFYMSYSQILTVTIILHVRKKNITRWLLIKVTMKKITNSVFLQFWRSCYPP